MKLSIQEYRSNELQVGREYDVTVDGLITEMPNEDIIFAFDGTRFHTVIFYAEAKKKWYGFLKNDQTATTLEKTRGFARQIFSSSAQTLPADINRYIERLVFEDGIDISKIQTVSVNLIDGIYSDTIPVL